MIVAGADEIRLISGSGIKPTKKKERRMKEDWLNEASRMAWITLLITWLKQTGALFNQSNQLSINQFKQMKLMNSRNWIQ